VLHKQTHKVKGFKVQLEEELD